MAGADQADQLVDELSASSGELVNALEEIEGAATEIDATFDALETASAEATAQVEDGWAKLEEEATGLVTWLAGEQSRLATELEQALGALSDAANALSTLEQTVAGQAEAEVAALGEEGSALEEAAAAVRAQLDEIETVQTALAEQFTGLAAGATQALDSAREQYGETLLTELDEATGTLEGQGDQVAASLESEASGRVTQASEDFAAKAGEIEQLVIETLEAAIENSQTNFDNTRTEAETLHEQALSARAEASQTVAQKLAGLRDEIDGSTQAVEGALRNFDASTAETESSLNDATDALGRVQSGFEYFLRNYKQ